MVLLNTDIKFLHLDGAGGPGLLSTDIKFLYIEGEGLAWSIF